MNKAITTLIFAVTSSLAYSSQGSSTFYMFDESKGVRYYVSREIAKNVGNVRVLVLTDYARATMDPGRNYSSALVEYEIRCRPRGLKSNGGIFREGTMLTGRNLGKDNGDLDWQVPADGTRGAALLKFYCDWSTDVLESALTTTGKPPVSILNAVIAGKVPEKAALSPGDGRPATKVERADTERTYTGSPQAQAKASAKDQAVEARALAQTVIAQMAESNDRVCQIRAETLARPFQNADQSLEQFIQNARGTPHDDVWNTYRAQYVVLYNNAVATGCLPNRQPIEINQVTSHKGKPSLPANTQINDQRSSPELHKQRLCSDCSTVVEIQSVKGDNNATVAAAVGRLIGGILSGQSRDIRSRDTGTTAGAIGGTNAGSQAEKSKKGASNAFNIVLLNEGGEQTEIRVNSDPKLKIGDVVRIVDGQIVRAHP